MIMIISLNNHQRNHCSETDSSKLPVAVPNPCTMILYSSPTSLCHDTRELKPKHPAPSSFPATHWKPQEVNTEILLSYSADPVAAFPSLHVEAVMLAPVPTTRYQVLGAVWDVPQKGNEIVGFPTVVPDVIDPTAISAPCTGGVLVQGVDVAPVVTAVEVCPVEVAPVEVTPVALPDFDDEMEVLLFCLDVSSTTPSIEA